MNNCIPATYTKKEVKLKFNRVLFEKEKIISVIIKIEGIPIKVLVDTGSSYNIISKFFFTTYSIDKPIISITELQGLGGDHKTPNVNVNLKIDNFTEKELLVCVTDFKVDENNAIMGIIGLETLMDYNAIIDLQNFELTLQTYIPNIVK